MKEPSKELKEKFPGAYDLIPDLDDAIAKSYKVYYQMPPELTKLYKEKFQLDIEAYNGPSRTALPFPATFVISKEGKIASAFCETDYRKRMEPKDILIALSKLPKNSDQ